MLAKLKGQQRLILAIEKSQPIGRQELMRFYILIAVTFLLSFVTAQAAEQTVKLAGLEVTVWSKEPDKAVKQPIIIFSHGFHGCATQSRFLMEAFASAGYIVFAPNHRDAVCNKGRAHWYSRAAKPLRKPGTWNDTIHCRTCKSPGNLPAAYPAVCWLPCPVS